ncbi:MAG TPA: NADH-quinone oxidoreductase subunit H [Spirochaetota bacterium]|nr:NADH-quinone oxidoreductase subunit H [Spirochaetota bacterium]
MDILTAVINALIFLALAPFFEGVIRRLYARVQSRKGPPLIQPYLDLLKLLGKETLSAGNWAFRIAPMMALASIM